MENLPKNWYCVSADVCRVCVVAVFGGWRLVVGCWWLVFGGWRLVVGCCLLMAVGEVLLEKKEMVENLENEKKCVKKIGRKKFGRKKFGRKKF